MYFKNEDLISPSLLAQGKTWKDFPLDLIIGANVLAEYIMIVYKEKVYCNKDNFKNQGATTVGHALNSLHYKFQALDLNFNNDNNKWQEIGDFITNPDTTLLEKHIKDYLDSYKEILVFFKIRYLDVAETVLYFFNQLVFEYGSVDDKGKISPLTWGHIQIKKTKNGRNGGRLFVCKQ